MVNVDDLDTHETDFVINLAIEFFPCGIGTSPFELIFGEELLN